MFTDIGPRSFTMMLVNTWVSVGVHADWHVESTMSTVQVYVGRPARFIRCHACQRYGQYWQLQSQPRSLVPMTVCRCTSPDSRRPTGCGRGACSGRSPIVIAG